MTWVLMLVVLMAGAAAQVLAPAPAWLAGAKPPLLLAAVLYYALVHGGEAMAVAALAAGILQDSLGATPLGTSSVCFGAMGLLAVRFRRLVMADALVTQALFGLVAGLASAALSGALVRIESGPELPLGGMLFRIQCSGVLGMFSAPVMFAFAGRLDRMVGNVDAADEEMRPA